MEPVRYIDKTRDYYRSLGYETPYRWAHFEHIPFAPLAGSLAGRRVGVITTAELRRRDVPPDPAWDDPARDPYALPIDAPPEQLYSGKDSYDRYATTLADLEAYLPLARLREQVAAGRLGGLAPRFQVVFSNYSQRKTMEVDAPAILRQLKDDRVDVAVLTAV